MSIISTLLALIPMLLKGFFFWSLKKAGSKSAELKMVQAKLETLRRAKEVDDTINRMPISVVRERLQLLSKRIQARAR
jgi:hypothetical protein